MESLPQHTQLTAVAVVAMAALACGLTMQRFRQPPLLGYILAGVILGPSGIALVEDRSAIALLAELGVLMLLFLLGMELSLRGIRQVWKIALFTTSLQIAAALGVMFGLGAMLDWPVSRSLLLGFVVAISSTAVAVKMLEDIGELRTRVGQVTVGILIAQDMAVVPMMLIVGALGEASDDPYRPLVNVLLSVTFLVLLIAYLSRRQRIRLPFVHWARRSKELTPLAALAFCFGAAGLSGALGLSAAYGAFLAGLVIGNSTSRRIMIHSTAPIQSVLLMMFFLSIGLLLDLDFLVDNIALVLGIVAFIALFKTALNIGLIRLLGETWPRAFLSGVLLAQIGEFSFIMAALGVSAGAVSDQAYRLIVAVTVLSLVVSPIWLEIARRLHRITLLGITSPRETMRLTIGLPASSFWRSRLRSDDRMVEMATSATRWVGDITPRSGRGAGKLDPPRPGRQRRR